MAIFRPPALTIPIQGCHLKYIWDGTRIAEVYEESRLKSFLMGDWNKNSHSRPYLIRKAHYKINLHLF